MIYSKIVLILISIVGMYIQFKTTPQNNSGATAYASDELNDINENDKKLNNHNKIGFYCSIISIIIFNVIQLIEQIIANQ